MQILKKIFFLFLFLTVLSGLFWGVYNLSFKKSETVSQKETSQAENSAEEKKEKIVSAEKIAVVLSEAVISPTLSADGNKVEYFSKNDGNAYAADFYGSGKKVIYSSKSAGLVDAFWSVDKTGVILKLSDGTGNYFFSYHNFERNSDAPIKKNVDEVVWQKNANRIFYKYYDSSSRARSLNISDPDGTNWKKLADITYRNISISQIPKTGEVSFWNTPDAFSATIFEAVPMIGGETKKLAQSFFGVDYLWNNSGDYILSSQSNEKGGSKMQLGVMNKNGGEYRNLGLPTFVSKCVWSKDDKTIFCALPGGMPDNAVLPNDYLEKKFNTADTFWKIDIKTGEKTRIVETAEIREKYDAENLFLDQSESLLFFVNRIDSKLYKIIL